MIHLQEKSIHQIFVIGLILKGANAILEIIGGMFFLFTGSVVAVITLLVQGELVEDPADFLATHIQKSLPYFASHGQLFAASYLLSHGVIKIFLVTYILRGKPWAYPVTIVMLLLFIVYQLYRLHYSFSIFLIILTLFDVFMIVLTWHEYKVVKSTLNKSKILQKP